MPFERLEMFVVSELWFYFAMYSCSWWGMASQFSNTFHVVPVILNFTGITYHVLQLNDYSHILPPFSRGVTVIISSVRHTAICLPGWNETLLHRHLFPTAMNFPSISLDRIVSDNPTVKLLKEQKDIQLDFEPHLF